MPSLTKEEMQKLINLRDLYMKSSSWIRDMSAPHAPRVLRTPRNPGKRAAGSGL
tara:strand:+ start:2444 stop:2605 length:162 start_codon:yes stop_codon:yes gene_type:complete